MATKQDPYMETHQRGWLERDYARDREQAKAADWAAADNRRTETEEERRWGKRPAHNTVRRSNRRR